MANHRSLDARSLALHERVARRLIEDQHAFAHAQSTLARWRLHADERVQPYLAAWQAIMAEGVQACIDTMLEDSERAAALRQASPFAGLLSNAERFDVLKAWREEQSRAAS
ncbi:hypothetical protein [Ottowia sp.]|nr:hypothetical protein [Ottowia sp.]